MSNGLSSKILRRLTDFLTKRGYINPSNLRKSIFYQSYLNNQYDINSPDEGNIQVEFKDKRKVVLRTDSSDIDVFYQIFIEQEYQFLHELIKEFVGSEKELSIIDCGANIGLFPVFLAETQDIGTLIMIEPDARNFNQCQMNTKTLKAEKTLYNKAIWSKKTTMQLQTFRDGRDWSKSYEPGNSYSINAIETVTFKEIFNENNISTLDILKIDIEGGEKNLIENPSIFSEVLRNTRILAIEIHDEVVSRIAFTKFLRDLNFDIYSRAETLYAVNNKL